MTVILQHVGKKGVKGQDGKNGLGVNSVDYSKISSTFHKVFNKNDLSPQVTWTRNTEASFIDRYGLQKTIPSDTSRQVIGFTNSFVSANWTPQGGNWTVDTLGITDPYGGSGATQVTLGDSTGDTDSVLGFTYGVTLGETYRVSMWVQVVSGTITGIDVAMSGTDYAGGSSFDISSIGSTWVRLNTVITANSLGFFRLLFKTTGAVINIYQVNVTEGIQLYSERLNAATDFESFSTGSIVIRENNKGYLIEPDSTNLCPYSEDLTKWDITGGGVVGVNTTIDSFDEGGSNTALTLINPTTTVSLSGLDLTPGTEYTISFYAVADDGLIASIGVSLGGSEFQTADTSTDFTRQIVKCQVDSGDNIVFNLVTTTSNSTIILAGIQVEFGEATGYIPTGPDARVRAHDSVQSSVSIVPSLAQPFTMQIKWQDIFQNLLDKYLINIDDLFSVRLNDNQLIFKGAGSDLLTIDLDSPTASEAIFVFTGTQVIIYIDTTLSGSASYNGEQGPLNSFYIGSVDGAGTNSISGFIESLNFWNYPHDADEIKFISGV